MDDPSDCLEIERRYIVRSLDMNALAGLPTAHIVQGYLGDSRDAERIRIINHTSAMLTRKTGAGEIRIEKECGIPLEVARFHLKSTPYLISKIRRVLDGWEINFFCGALTGLILAEYERKSIDDPTILPSWITEAEEVTDWLDNAQLARIGYEIKQSGYTGSVLELLERPLPRIVLTGGPCSGKSTIIDALRDVFAKTVYVVPETATMVIGGLGAQLPEHRMGKRHFNRELSNIQRSMEHLAEMQARAEGKRALLLDRAVPDNGAYLDGGLSELAEILRTDIESEYGRHDLVLCLGMPPKEHYETSRGNNKARSETYELAQFRHALVEGIWEKHPRYHHIPYDGAWSTKLNTAISLISTFLGM